MGKTTDSVQGIADAGFDVVERTEDIPQFENEAAEAAFWSTHTPSVALMKEAESLPDDGLPSLGNA